MNGGRKAACLWPHAMMRPRGHPGGEPQPRVTPPSWGPSRPTDGIPVLEALLAAEAQARPGFRAPCAGLPAPSPHVQPLTSL